MYHLEFIRSATEPECAAYAAPFNSFTAPVMLILPPVGLELLGQAGDDTHLLALGMAVERSLPPIPAPAGTI